MVIIVVRALLNQIRFVVLVEFFKFYFVNLELCIVVRTNNNCTFFRICCSRIAVRFFNALGLDAL